MWLRSSCVLLFLFSECLTTKITRLSVPPEISLDDYESQDLVLDCEYELESHEGLVISWFLNDEKIYKWIMGYPPTSKQSLKKYIDVQYNVSDDPAKQYRALRLLNPDRSFSGEYACTVSTDESEDKQHTHLQFYDPGDALNLTYSVQSGNDTDSEADDLVVLHCKVDRVFPEPDLTIFVNEEVVNQTQINLEAGEDGYNSTVTATLPVSNVTDGDIFRCDLKIPHTTYNDSDTASYIESVLTGEAAWVDEDGESAAMELTTDSPGDLTGGASAVTGHLLLLTALTSLLQYSLQEP